MLFAPLHTKSGRAVGARAELQPFSRLVRRLHHYVAEFDYRYTTNKTKDGERTLQTIRRVAGKRLRYENTRAI